MIQERCRSRTEKYWNRMHALRSQWTLVNGFRVKRCPVGHQNLATVYVWCLNEQNRVQPLLTLPDNRLTVAERTSSFPNPETRCQKANMNLLYYESLFFVRLLLVDRMIVLTIFCWNRWRLVVSRSARGRVKTDSMFFFNEFWVWSLQNVYYAIFYCFINSSAKIVNRRVSVYCVLQMMNTMLQFICCLIFSSMCSYYFTKCCWTAQDLTEFNFAWCMWLIGLVGFTYNIYTFIYTSSHRRFRA